MKKFLLIFLLPVGCLSQVLPVGDPGEEIDAGYDFDTNTNDSFLYSDTNKTVETSKELDSIPPNYFNCNGDPCALCF